MPRMPFRLTAAVARTVLPTMLGADESQPALVEPAGDVKRKF